MKVIWHKSSEELPQLNKTVIGCDSLRNPHIVRLIENRSPKGLYWVTKDYSSVYKLGEIIHWAESDNPELCMMAWSVM